MGERDPWTSVEVRSEGEGSGRWSAVIEDLWTVFNVPLGGLSAAVGARAMAAELAAHHGGRTAQRLRTLHCMFVAPVPCGEVVADVTLLRSGRTQSHARVDVHGAGQPAGLTALGAFGASRPGYAFAGLRPPPVPRPEDCPSFRDPPPPEVEWQPERTMALWEEVLEGRPADGLPPWDTTTPRTSSERSTWYRFDAPPPPRCDGVDPGPHELDPCGAVAVADLMLGGVDQRIGEGGPDWFGPSVDLTIHLVGPLRDGWLLSHNRTHVAADGYASVETALWGPAEHDGDLSLVAFATQQMYFHFPGGAPSPEALRIG